MIKKYTISDGKLCLYLWPAEEGGYVVTSPLDPELVTEAETLEEAFRMAHDARKCLIAARRKQARKLGAVSATNASRAAQPNVQTEAKPVLQALPPGRRGRVITIRDTPPEDEAGGSCSND